MEVPRPGRAALVLACVLALPASRARADDHVRRSESGRAEHWPSGVVHVRFDAALLGGYDDSERAALLAAAAWADVPQAPELVVDGPTEAAAPRSLDGEHGIYVVSAHDWPFDARLLAMTVSAVDPSSGEILDADVWVNGGRRIALLDASAPAHDYDAGAVLTHELGHVLGLAENHDDAAATMWPTFRRGDVHQRVPDASDAASIAEAYAGVIPSVPGATYERVSCDAGAPGGKSGGGPVQAAVILGVALAGWLAKRRRDAATVRA